MKAANIFLNSGKIFLFGGMDNPRSYFGDSWIFDSASLTWTKLSLDSAPSARYSHSATSLTLPTKEKEQSHPTHILIAGGNTPLVLNDMYIYDIVENSWKTANYAFFENGVLPNSDPDHRICLTRHTATQIGNSVFFIGGGLLCFSFGSHFNSLHVLDFGKQGTRRKTQEIAEPKIKPKKSTSHSIPTKTQTVSIPVLEHVTYEQFMKEISPNRRPAILRGLDIGPCVSTNCYSG